MRAASWRWVHIFPSGNPAIHVCGSVGFPSPGYPDFGFMLKAGCGACLHPTCNSVYALALYSLLRFLFCTSFPGWINKRACHSCSNNYSLARHALFVSGFLLPCQVSQVPGCFCFKPKKSPNPDKVLRLSLDSGFLGLNRVFCWSAKDPVLGGPLFIFSRFPRTSPLFQHYHATN
jgi:hypothetical protein